ncbi:MAG: undecaprenyl/decaprenyl-phosphate alpha-N-acetylglucosaminyl 1-phosphate transferase [Planctomycetaceae bacterium]|nr:undecaprenyl/decaprenyl-phosphate alpha-N-acetylglucosaminyl 1-phosphate transferase [Planctomycetaceae bacterium]
MDSRNLLLFLAGSVVPSFVVALLATYAVRRYAPAWGLIDQPGERKVHTLPTPRGGGLAIWMGVVGTFAIAQLLLLLATSVPAIEALVPDFARPHLAGIWSQSARLWIILAAGTALAILGLMDDRGGLSWQLRLLAEFAIAIVCVWLVPDLRLTAFVNAPLVTGALSVLWIVALINSFNMLDNMDALSGGVAAIAASMLAAVLLLAPDPQTQRPQLFVAGLLLVLVGALLGFLWHNRPPAKIFMGDSGAYFIGFMIAVATLLASYTSYQSERRHAILAPLCVMAVPLYDMTSVILIRLLSGKSPFQPDKNHFSHRLVDLGLTKTQAVLTVYLTTATCGLGALLLHQVEWSGAIVIMLLIGCVLTLIGVLESTARRTIKR